MAISVRLDPIIEARVDAEAQRLGISKSQWVKGALERMLGAKNPAELLLAVRSGTPMGDAGASENVSDKVKAKLRVKRSSGCSVIRKTANAKWTWPMLRSTGSRSKQA